VSDSKNGFLVEWDKVKEASYYVVYQIQRQGKKETSMILRAISFPFSAIRPISSMTTILGKFRKYTYAVASLNRLFKESGPGESFTTKWKKLR
jgi:DNA-binding PadR family transcriptional regulator